MSLHLKKWILCTGVTLGLASLQVQATSNVGASFLNQADYETQSRAEWTEEITSQDIPGIKDILLSTFYSPQDKAYFEKFEKTYKPMKLHVSASEARGQVSIFGDGMDVLLSHFDRTQKSFKINGVAFRVESGKSLEYHVTKIAKIISKKKSAGWLQELVVSEAYADEGDRSFFSTLFFILPKAITDISTHSLYSSLQDTLSYCEKRDGKIPYEKSKAYQWLQMISSKKVFSIDEQSRITDCAAWAKQDSRVPAVGAPRLEKLCNTGAQVVKCMDAYKAQSPSTAAPAKQQQPTAR